MKRIALLCVAVGLSASCGSSKHATGTTTTSAPSSTLAQRPTSTPVSGRWVNPTAAVTIGVTEGVIKQRSGTIWTGDLSGKTTYISYVHAVPNQTGAFAGTIDEIFSGSVRGIGRGQLFLAEKITVSATGAVLNIARITRGTGGLVAVRGNLRFTGTANLSGIGNGPYTGMIHR